MNGLFCTCWKHSAMKSLYTHTAHTVASHSLFIPAGRTPSVSPCDLTSLLPSCSVHLPYTHTHTLPTQYLPCCMCTLKREYIRSCAHVFSGALCECERVCVGVSKMSSGIIVIHKGEKKIFNILLTRILFKKNIKLFFFFLNTFDTQ